MMVLFDHLLSIAQVWLATFFGVFLRVGACFFVLPGLGEQMIPMRVRLGAALAMSLLLTPMLQSRIDISGLLPPAHAFLGEALVGLCLGLALRFVVYALQTAGTIAAQATSLSQIMGGASPDPLPAMGAILSLAGLRSSCCRGCTCTWSRPSCNPMTYFHSEPFPARRTSRIGASAMSRRAFRSPSRSRRPS
jgi:flagellar biosynthetic protein FliR